MFASISRVYYNNTSAEQTSAISQSWSKQFPLKIGWGAFEKYLVNGNFSRIAESPSGCSKNIMKSLKGILAYK